MNYPWNHNRRYNDFPTHFKKMFQGERVQKVSIDAGFTCPNRDGKLATKGCAYCNNKTFKPGYCRIEESITEQVEKGINFFAKKYQSMQFLGYFQAYTNTYASVQELKTKYEEALKQEKIIGLVIGTRPDCLPPDVLDYLTELAQQYYIMVEFGIESINDSTLQRINRGHSYAEAVRAIEETSKRGIHNCGHLILGLPGETRADFLHQAREISKIPVENIKLHQLQIHRNTQLAKDYAHNPSEFNLFSLEDYLELCVDYLELLNPNIIIERFISQSPKDMLIAPQWGIKNFEFVAKLEKKLQARNTWQGRLFEQ
ncbi:MAG: TIGR01212 family radical SAM protein [Mangrovibacterium sp.]